MAKGRQLVGRVVTDAQTVSLTLERVPRDDGALIWQFSADTVARVPDLYWTFSYGVVGAWLPPVLIETHVLGLALWQWMGLVVLIAASILVAVALVRPGMPVTRWVISRWRIAADSPTFARGVAPLRVLLALVVFRAAQGTLALPVSALSLVSTVQKFLLIVTVVWLAARFVEGMGALARRRLLARQETSTLPMVDFAQRAAKILLVILAVLVLLQAIGVQISALVTAVGVGGIGLALAGQRIVENMFSGLVLMGDQPVRVGDFCRFGPHEGTIERIGLWSTRVRTLGRSVVSVPNAQFLMLQVENIQRRDRILFQTTLPLRYETTPDQLRWIVVRIREMFYSHPRVDPDPARVRLTGFGAHSLDVEVFAYILTADWEDFVAQREDLSLRIMDIVAAAGTCFALPAQINYGEADRLDPGRGAAAAAEVERWRQEARLPLPEFPPERIQALRAAARRNSG
jgi:MscS family membrane protein